MSRTSKFNCLLCKGLIHMKDKSYKNALSLFTEAQSINPKNRDIVFYKASAMVMELLEITKKEELNYKRLKALIDPIIGELSVGVRIYPRSEYFLRFYRGILYLYTHDYDKAATDLHQAIKNNEESNYKYHMYMGLSYACMNLLKEALNDFTIAIKMKEDYLTAYYNRGKCAYLLGNTDLAFSDFQKLLLINPVSVVLKNRKTQ